MAHYDLCVIGSGPAGTKAAIQAAKLGKRVVVVERREVVGGVAINTGTIPSKALREAILKLVGHESAMPSAHDFQAARNATFTGLLGSCQRVIRREIEVVSGHFRRNGIDVINGDAQFVDERTVLAVGSRANERVTADHFLIAVGTRPARPASIPFDGQNIITSDELLELPYLPNSMLVIGGGVIGTEYASMLQQLGVNVTLVEARPRVLDFVDAEIVEALQYHLRRAGMTLRLGERVTRVEAIEAPHLARSGNEQMAQVTLESGKTLRADCLLYAIGRQGATDELNLPGAGLEADKRGRITVDEKLQTSTPGIYAAGDVIGFPALASTSAQQGRQAACHMFGVATHPASELIPYGVYSIPEISMVGWTESRLTEEEVPYEAGIARYEEIARGALLGDEDGMLKMLVHQETRHVLGVHAIGTGVTELIHIGQAAIAHQATIDYFVEAVFNYPTLAECYKVAAYNALNRLQST